MHLVLEAMGELKAEYPDIRLYVAGNNIIRKQSIKDLLKLPAYGKYLLKLIKKYHLEEQVVMLGRISAEQMKKRMLHWKILPTQWERPCFWECLWQRQEPEGSRIF